MRYAAAIEIEAEMPRGKVGSNIAPDKRINKNGNQLLYATYKSSLEAPLNN